MAKKNNDLFLVIDMQNVYLPSGDWACPSMPEAIEAARRLIDADVIGKTIFTQYVAPEEPAGRWKEYNREYRDINENVHLGAIVPQLVPCLSKGELLTKSTYSSLTVPAIRKAALEADRVLLSGVVAECCILATLMEAIDLGCHVVYLTDAVSGQTPENEAMVRHVAELFSPIHCIVTDSRSYLRDLA